MVPARSAGLAASFVLASLPGAQQAAPAGSLPIPDELFSPRPVHRALFTAPEDARLAELRAAGAVRWELDYGSFRWVGVDEVLGGGEEALRASGIEWHDEEDRIVFDGLTIDAARPGEAFARLDPAELLGDPRGGALDPDAGLYVLQFRGPVQDEWQTELEAAGARFVQYVPVNAYVIALEPGAVGAFASLAAQLPAVQYLGVYQPVLRMKPALRELARTGTSGARPMTIQLVEGPGAARVLRDIETLSTSAVTSHVVDVFRDVQCELDPVYLRWLAAQPDVFGLEPRGIPHRDSIALEPDERQGQIVAGNVSGAAPTGPGYLAWLAAKGFDSTQFTTFSVNVVDDALTLSGHPDLASGRIAFTQNPSNLGGQQSGHGFLNGQIIAGLNSGTGSAVEDSGGYNYGLGIAPWARVGSTAIFGPTNVTPTSYESTAYNLGARISSNSWTYVDPNSTPPNGPIPDYDSGAREFDVIVRDARSGVSGNQEYTVVFAAGNDGATPNTVSTPATAKNVITAGASENNRQTGTDGCGISNIGANDLRDVIAFSSRGPVNSAGGDGRIKPDLCAPGTHVQAGIPQSNYTTNMNDLGVCNFFFPSGQTLYSWSSGTSHSCPAISGGCALVRQWFLNQGFAAPSPAMTKAVLGAAAEYMTGNGANDTLPSNSQGIGRMYLERAFDGVARILVDQTTVFGATGQTFTTSGSVSDNTKPVRIALVWTDAPGPTTGAPYVNNLNLTATVNGTAYKGNVFSGGTSITGGSADAKNNTEYVFLPAGTTGPVSITVTAAAIGGDGVPHNSDTTDQDFALVAYNVTTTPPPVAEFVGAPLSGTAPLAVTFTNQSTGTITSHAWTFGDGGTSTLASPTYTYNAAGTYTVALTETGPGGSNTRTRTNYVVVTQPPVAEFVGSPTSGVAPLGVNFTNQSTGTITSHAWTFGDGGTSTLASPSHTYNASGTYTVALTETGPDGSSTRTRTNYITVSDPPPVADFTGSPTSGIAPLLVSFTNLSTGPVTSHAWTFGDGGTSTLASPTHTYNTPGTYTVSLTETGPGGSDTKTRVAYIVVADPLPVADFTATPRRGRGPLLVSFTDLSTAGVTAWSWDFGDGATSTAQNPTHAYRTGGLYTVTLTVTSPSGSDQEIKTNYIRVRGPRQ